MPASIQTLRLRLSNVHLVVGDGPVLFDTGSPGDAARILTWIDGLGLPRPRAIILTHAHGDHAGSAAELRRLTGAPIALAAGDRAMAEAGKNRPLRPVRASAWPLTWLVPHRFPAFTPDVTLEDRDALRAFGLDAELVATPGHTPGSISALFPDGQAIAGDLLMGGYIGGQVRPRRPRAHYFADDPAANAASLARLRDLGARRLHLGHGGPLDLSRMETPR